VVHGPGRLDAVVGELPRAEHGPGVVDQDVEACVPIEHVVREAAHRRLRGQVGHGVDEATEPERVLTWAAERVASHKRVRRYELIDTVPHTDTGKIVRRGLIEPERELQLQVVRLG
jgi:acyl-CoA synthetase (AMP-forming)/AMP-acid ligase II